MTSLIKWTIIHIMFMITLFSGEISYSIAAESAKHPIILSIDVEGNRFMEQDAVLAKLRSKIGQPLDRRLLSRDVRRLYKAGFFSDIRFVGARTPQGIKLICQVKEFPLIAKLDIEGNDEHTTKDLLLKMKLKPGAIFNPKSRISALNILLKGYLKDGFYQVNVDFIPTPRDDGRINLLVRIHEGDITRINRIHIIGNDAFSDSTLRLQLASRQLDLLSSFGSRAVFDQKRFGADAQMLQQYYMNNGYMDMKVESSQITISEDKKNFSLTFSIHEGHPYTVSSLALQGDLLPDKNTLKELIEMEVDDMYSLIDLQRTIANITERIGDEGYAFASVTPLLKRNIDNHTVSITFDIEKGQEVYIERIEITGNEKTEDTVVRRHIIQSEGARYSGTQIRNTKGALGRALFVEDLRISHPKGSAADKVLMKVDLTEKRTGSISGGIGYSQREKVILTAKLSESNAFGKAYQASLNGQYGRITQDIRASLTDPYFFNNNISATIGAFKKQTDPAASANYQTDSVGGNIGFGVPITHNVSYSINYSLNSSNLSNVSPLASLATLAQVGRQTIGELTQSLTWESRDRLVGARDGHVESITFGFTGIGGQSKFWETTASSQVFIPLDTAHKFTLNPSIYFGMVRPYAKSSVPLWRRYSLGGVGTVKGFDSSGISLRDPVSGDPLGGDKKVHASLNLFFPLPFMTDVQGVRGYFFTDAGTVWGSIYNINEPFSLSRVRSAAGFGIEWISPVGPVGLVWAFPITTAPGDIERTFEFVLGGMF